MKKYMKKKRKVHYITIITILIAVLCIAGCEQQQEWTPQYNEQYTVFVTSVIDGDTINVILPNDTISTIRFLGIDCPEKTAQANQQNEYGNITNRSCLAFYGNKATSYIEELINQKQINIEFDQNSGFKDVYDRWLAYVYLPNGTDVNILLLQHGYARAYTEGDCSHETEYVDMQQTAIENNRGLWTCTHDE
ncbi:MAG: thermonuclease family protein [Thermoplasmatota archaeon]